MQAVNSGTAQSLICATEPSLATAHMYMHHMPDSPTLLAAGAQLLSPIIVQVQVARTLPVTLQLLSLSSELSPLP